MIFLVFADPDGGNIIPHSEIEPPTELVVDPYRNRQVEAFAVVDQAAGMLEILEKIADSRE